MPTIEEKHKKFLELAQPRTNKVLDAIRVLSNCSSRVNYEYSQEEVDRIFDAIQNELDNARAKFAPKKSKEANNFSFD